MKIIMVVEEIDKEPCILIDSPYIKNANFKSGDILSVNIKRNKIIVQKAKSLRKKLTTYHPKKNLIQKK